jgi:hypothetical protein
MHIFLFSCHEYFATSLMLSLAENWHIIEKIFNAAGASAIKRKMK